MTIKDRNKRDIKLFEQKMGLNGEQQHTYEELSRKFNLSKAQVARNVYKVAFKVIEEKEANDSGTRPFSTLVLSTEELEKIYNTYIAAYQKSHGPDSEG